MPFRGIPWWAMPIERREITRGRLSETRIGENNPYWKGDKVSYVGLHDWVKSRLPKPILCEKCKRRKPHDLANKSGAYKRDLTDWEWICRRCHMDIDGRLVKLHLIPISKKNLMQGSDGRFKRKI